MIDEAEDVLKFKWDRLNQKFESDTTLAGRKQAVDEFLQTVATGIQAGNLSPIDRGMVVNRLSGMIGLGTRQIEIELVRRMRSGVSAPGKSPRKPSDAGVLGQGINAVTQREILEVLLNEPRLYQSFQEDIAVETFDDPILKQVAQRFFELLKVNPEANGTDLLARIDSVEVGQVVAELMLVGEQKGNFQLRIEGAIDVLRRTRLFAQRDVAGQESLELLNARRTPAGERNTRSLGFM
jgi:hypothetical protein